MSDVVHEESYILYELWRQFMRVVSFELIKIEGMWSNTDVSSRQQFSTVTHQSSFSSSGWVQVPQRQQQTVVQQIVQPTSAPEAIPSKGCETNQSSSSSPTPFDEAVLDEHNRLRAKHSAAPLTLDPAISRYAQEWANVSDLSQ